MSLSFNLIYKFLNPIYSPRKVGVGSTDFSRCEQVFHESISQNSTPITSAVTSSGTFFDQTITVPIASLTAGDVLWFRENLSYSNASGFSASETFRVGNFTISGAAITPTNGGAGYREGMLRVTSIGSGGKVSGLLFGSMDVVNGLFNSGLIYGGSGISVDFSSNIVLRGEFWWNSPANASSSATLTSLEAAILRP